MLLIIIVLRLVTEIRRKETPTAREALRERYNRNVSEVNSLCCSVDKEGNATAVKSEIFEFVSEFLCNLITGETDLRINQIEVYLLLLREDHIIVTGHDVRHYTYDAEIYRDVSGK